MGDESKWINESKFLFGNQVVFDCGFAIFNYKREIYELETFYSQSLIPRLCSAFQTMQQNTCPSYSPSRQLWETGKSQSSGFQYEIFRSSTDDPFQHGINKCKASFVLWIEGIQGLYPWRNGDHTWSCCISRLPLCPTLWTAGYDKSFCSFQWYFDSSVLLLSPWFGAKEESMCVYTGQQHPQGNRKRRPRTWVTLVLKSSK